MPNYRRNRIEGGTFFFTLALADRRSDLLVQEIAALRASEHTIRNEADFARHADYVHFNPVKHGIVGNAKDWPFSSFRRAVASTQYPLDWGVEAEVDGEYGERPDG